MANKSHDSSRSIAEQPSALRTISSRAILGDAKLAIIHQEVSYRLHFDATGKLLPPT